MHFPYPRSRITPEGPSALGQGMHFQLREEGVPIRTSRPHWKHMAFLQSGALQNAVHLDMSQLVLYTLVGGAPSSVLLVWVCTKAEEHQNHLSIILLGCHMKRIGA